MKKVLLSISTLLLTIGSYAQPFFEVTTYRGAFGATDWTTGWANFNPQRADYSGTITETISEDITSNKTISGIVSLVNKVYVTGGAEITILPGTIIKGDKTSKSALIITRGSKIHATGTVSQPIVFTSAFSAGSRSLGDWGGLVILGAAPNNASSTVAGANGFPVIEGGFDATKANYGGTNSSDNSGELKYVRIEFAGVVFSSNDEINGLTMGSVGSATYIDYVQVSYANDDAFEWFGGNVNCKHIISFSNIDDDFDSDFGFQGNVQYGLIIRDATLADAAGASNGFESDNNTAGTAVTPQTKAIFSNITAVGPYKGNITNSIQAQYNLGLHLRRNTAISVINSVFTDFKIGFRMEGNAAIANYTTNNTAKFKNIIFAGNGRDFNTTSVDGTFFQLPANNNTSLGSTMDAANIYTDPYNATAPNFTLIPNSPAATGADFTDAIFGTTSISETETSSAQITLYPNPTESSATIDVGSESALVSILNVNGTVVKSLSVNSKATIEGLSSGLYFVRVTSKGTTKILKLVVL